MRTLSTIAILFSLCGASAEGLKEKLALAVNARDGQKIMSSAAFPQVILFIGYLNGCPLFAKYQNTLKELKKEFGEKLLIVNFDPDQSRSKTKERIKALDKLGNKFPLLLDPAGEINQTLGISLASEAAVVLAADGRLIYRGAIDDSRTLDFERPKAEHQYAREAIQAVLKGNLNIRPFTTASGCTLNTKSSTK